MKACLESKSEFAVSKGMRGDIAFKKKAKYKSFDALCRSVHGNSLH